MKKSKNKFLIFAFLFLLFPFVSRAVCPVCTVAIAGGVGLSRWLGIDDVISGIWIGGLIVSLSLWFISWLEKRHIRFKLRSFLSFVLLYLITILPLYQLKIIGPSCSRIWGYDKMLVGIFFGSIGLGTGVLLEKFLKTRNKGKVYFYYQKVIIPISFLIVLSIVFYFITRCIK